MKILLSFLLILTISVQAQASGYAHNMFVAHKKLQTKKEAPKVMDKYPKEHTSVVRTQKISLSNQAQFSNADQAEDRKAIFSSLNPGMLHESRLNIFEIEEDDDSKSATKTIISALVEGVKRMVMAIFSIRG
ncbi:hypothetical protein [Dyadobacter tibetensis]|uniref:hypothetical protein n=1 Tax=Dyadobacter tibetensis TaxID=1211851 RepID=UPI00046E91BE|nr:hypothetical protein [Dyadobacter tibetensis]